MTTSIPDLPILVHTTERPPAPSGLPDYVTVATAALHFGLKRWQILRAIKRGELSSYRFFNTRILVRISDIRAAIEASRTGGSDD